MASDKVIVYLHGGDLSWFSEPALKLIQLGTDSIYFHVGIKYDDRFIIESTSSRGVDVRPFTYYRELIAEKDRFIDVYRCEEPIDLPAYYDWLSQQESRKYDKMGILKLAWLKATVQRNKANSWAKEKDFFCSELAMRGLRKHALKPGAFKDIPSTSIASPADIARSKSFTKIGSIQ